MSAGIRIVGTSAFTEVFLDARWPWSRCRERLQRNGSGRSGFYAIKIMRVTNEDNDRPHCTLSELIQPAIRMVLIYLAYSRVSGEKKEAC